MKSYITALLFIAISFNSYSQDFAKNLADAKSNYSNRNLSEARFAMEQLLHEIDMEIGKQILSVLPEKINGQSANVSDDNVNGTSAGMAAGLYVNRTYGNTNKVASIDIINNSPLIGSINTLLSLPFIGRSSDSDQKVVKVQGYKSILNKIKEENDVVSYELQIPFNKTLMTFKADDINEADFLKAAETIPLAKIAEFAQ